MENRCTWRVSHPSAPSPCFSRLCSTSAMRLATILLEAPHNFYDVGTGRLAAELFFTKREGARPRALFTNTIQPTFQSAAS